jgi:hypothetical protein
VKAAAARKRPLGESAAMVFFNWFVSTMPMHFPLSAAHNFMSVPGEQQQEEKETVNSKSFAQ